MIVDRKNMCTPSIVFSLREKKKEERLLCIVGRAFEAIESADFVFSFFFPNLHTEEAKTMGQPEVRSRRDSRKKINDRKLYY